MKKKIGAMIFGGIWLLVGGMFLLEYAQSGYITLKGNAVISGKLALVTSLCLLIFGMVFSLVTLLGKKSDHGEKAKADASDEKQ